ncbi:hypothetical protein DERF_007439 [Dermatophagoides farinae]|uniref:Uncharacterized protein n=1 Tax=Dermatophagoides farinae TaxID=6954 RepID=A0A922L805_DERFA|nr:hypothetical protein DERF_007439 [Dermatophagoides farinae]
MKGKKREGEEGYRSNYQTKHTYANRFGDVNNANVEKLKMDIYFIDTAAKLRQPCCLIWLPVILKVKNL